MYWGGGVLGRGTVGGDDLGGKGQEKLTIWLRVDKVLSSRCEGRGFAGEEIEPTEDWRCQAEQRAWRSRVSYDPRVG